MDSVFKALADPTRRKVIWLLKKKDMYVNEILTHLDISQASLSHHLDILKRANLVIAEKQGQYMLYSLNISVFEDVVWIFYDLFK